MAERRQIGHAHPDIPSPEPQRSTSLVNPSQAKRLFEGRRHDLNWSLQVTRDTGHESFFPPHTDWVVQSRFGSVRGAVALTPEGAPAFDRPEVEEAPNVNIVAWGVDKKTDNVKIGIISQARPHARDYFASPETGQTEAVVFEQIPMGFLEKAIGKDQLEAAGEGAIREVAEETGTEKNAVIGITYPEYPVHYPNPTFVSTGSTLVYVQVDLDQIEKMKPERQEDIFHAEYVSLPTLMDDLQQGKTDKGLTRMATANSALLIFLSHLSSFNHAESNEREANNAHRDDLIEAIAEANLPEGASYEGYKRIKSLVPDMLNQLAADPEAAFRKKVVTNS